MDDDLTRFQNFPSIFLAVILNQVPYYYVPKLFEGMVVDKSKDKIVKKCSKFQIGGVPKTQV